MKNIGLTGLALILIVLACSTANAQPTLPKGIIKLDGRPAPELVLSDLDEKSFDLAKHRGKWVFVHFWAAWCGPCRKEMPTINEIYPKFEDSHLKIVVINTAESDDTVFNFLGIAAPDLTPLMDKDGLATERWQPRGLPSTFFVDPTGRLRYLALGGRPWNKPEYIRFLNELSQSSLHSTEDKRTAK